MSEGKSQPNWAERSARRSRTRNGEGKARCHGCDGGKAKQCKCCGAYYCGKCRKAHVLSRNRQTTGDL